MKTHKLKIIKRENVEETRSVQKAAAVALIDSTAALRRGRRTGNAAVSSWITERRETENIARTGLIEMAFKNLFPGTK